MKATDYVYSGKVEMKKGFECAICGCFQYDHIPANLEDGEGWECHNCGDWHPSMAKFKVAQYF